MSRRCVGYRSRYFCENIGKEGRTSPPQAVITRTDTSASEAYGNFSPKIALNYSLSKEHNFYGIYSKGFRAGGISQLSSDPSAPPLVPYDSEYSDNFEIGSKNMFAGK